MNIQKIAHDISQYKPQITELLAAKNWQHFRWYFFLKENFLRENFGSEFVGHFTWFYALRGMNKLEKEIFFKILSSHKEVGLEAILEELSRIRGRVFLSFSTRLLHTKDNKLPIYDSFIASVYELPLQDGGTPLKKVISKQFGPISHISDFLFFFIMASSKGKISSSRLLKRYEISPRYK